MHPCTWSRLLHRERRSSRAAQSRHPAGISRSSPATSAPARRRCGFARSTPSTLERFLTPKGPRIRFFSPDGQVVAFFRNGQLTAADVTGKRQRTIAPVGGAPAGGSWGADDVIVFAEWMTGLFAVASTGGPVSPLTRLDHTALDVAHAHGPSSCRTDAASLSRSSVPTTREPACMSRVSIHEPARLLDDAAAAIYVAPGFLLRAARHVDGRAVRCRSPPPRRARGAPLARYHRAIAGRRERRFRLTRSARVPGRGQPTAVDVGRPIGCAAGLAGSPHVDVQFPRLSRWSIRPRGKFADRCDGRVARRSGQSPLDAAGRRWHRAAVVA